MGEDAVSGWREGWGGGGRGGRGVLAGRAWGRPSRGTPGRFLLRRGERWDNQAGSFLHLLEVSELIV